MHLGFEQLDELAFAVANHGALNIPQDGFLANNLGVIIELKWLADDGMPLPTLSELTDSRRVRLVQTIADGQQCAAFEDDRGAARLMNCYWQRDEQPDAWHDFCASMQKSAIFVGLPRKNAQELVAAARELVSNIFDHSGAPNSGLVGYSVVGKELELVVADRGMGVFESLRTSQEFNGVRDSGEAMEAALADGNSRFGRGSGHGNGFRNLFRGLLNLSTDLRFRSGDHALSIKGISPGLATARISQKVKLPGFVIRISCTT